MKTRQKAGLQRLGYSLLVLLLAACGTASSKLTSEEVIATVQSVAATYAAQTLAAIPTQTLTPSPTATPSIEDVILPEGSGELYKDGGQWFFNSPLETDIGKNVPVQILEHIYDDGTAETWLALINHPEWPLFIQNKEGGWETALEYVQVKRTLTDRGGYSFRGGPVVVAGPVPLTCVDLGKSHTTFYANYFFVVTGEPFQEGEIVYIPVAMSLDSSYDSPMFQLNIPVPPDGASKDEYPNRVFDPVSVAFIASRESIVSLLKTGDVFRLQFIYDEDDEYLDFAIEHSRSLGHEIWVKILQDFKNKREQSRDFLKSILIGMPDSFLLGKRFDLWIPTDFGIGTGK